MIPSVGGIALRHLGASTNAVSTLLQTLQRMKYQVRTSLGLSDQAFSTEALFTLGDVEGVFFGHSFISVTAGPGTNWADLKPDVLSILLDHFSANMPLFAASAAGINVAPEIAHDDDPADADIIVQIKELIETRVRPAVASDGGDIIYHGFNKGTVFLKMQGACSGCPSSTATLKNGIESLLKHYVPEVTDVRAI